MLRFEHYRAAGELLRQFHSDDSAYTADIPNLLRALAHAVLAGAAAEVEFGAEFPLFLDK